MHARSDGGPLRPVRRTLGRATAAALITGMVPLAATAQGAAPAFPAKPVTILVGFTAGGPVDITARTIGEQLSRKWGQPVIVDVRPGANGTAAAALLAKAPADGYTLLMGTRSITMNAALYTKLPYDPAKAFIPVAIGATQPTVLVVSNTFPARNVPALLKELKANPGKYSYATTGNGSIPHLAGELFQNLSGTRLNHIPYKGGSSLIVDVIAGRVDMTFGGQGTVIGQIRENQVVPIAVASRTRSPMLPNVPTFAEAGLADYNVDTWYGLLAPAGTPPEVVQKINADVNAALALPEVQQRLALGGSSTEIVSPQAYRRQYDEDLVRYGKLIRDLGLKLD